MVQKLGREADFLSALPGHYHAEILGAVAGTWVSVDLAVAHYAACDSLGLSTEQQVDIGRTVGAQVRGTLFGTIVALSKQVGATPALVYPAVPRFWPRVFDGSWIVVKELENKEAHFEVGGMPLIDARYFRNGLRGQIMAMLDLFCSRSYATSRNARFAPGEHSFRIQWA